MNLEESTRKRNTLASGQELPGCCYANRPCIAMHAAARGFIVALFGLAFLVTPTAAFEQELKPFFERYCHACHAEGAEEGGFQFEGLGADLDDEATFAKWVRIFDRVETSEMPPAEAQQPIEAHRSLFMKLLGDRLTEAHAKRKATVLRRLNHPAKIDELKIIEEAQFSAFSDFLAKLKGIEELGRSLLDHTAVLFGSNLGNASAHDWHNLPILVAVGGYRHGRYVAHDAQRNTPLANLFVDLAQRMGVESDNFGSSTAAGVRGLERVS